MRNTVEAFFHLQQPINALNMFILDSKLTISFSTNIKEIFRVKITFNQLNYAFIIMFLLFYSMSVLDKQQNAHVEINLETVTLFFFV